MTVFRGNPDYGALVLAAVCVLGGALLLAQGAYEGVVGIALGGLFALMAFRGD